MTEDHIRTPANRGPKGLLARWMRLFFHHLYTTFARFYDLVAWVSSIGQWRDWQEVGLEALPHGPILELGHGPGHSVVELSRKGRSCMALDLSPQMCELAAARLQRHGLPVCIARSRAQQLPFPAKRFAGVFAIFPTEFLFDPETLQETHRVLRSGGTLVVIPGVVEIGGTLDQERGPLSILDRLASSLYLITGQRVEPTGMASKAMLTLLSQHGFETRHERVRLARATVLRIVAQKLGN